MKLVQDWKQAWRWSSVHAMSAAAAVQGGWVALPDDMRRHIPLAVASAVTIGLLILGVVGRLRDQSPAAMPKPHVPDSNDFHQHENQS